MRRDLFALVPVVALFFGGCSAEDSTPEPCATPTALSRPADMPTGLDLTAWGDVIRAEVVEGFFVGQAITKTSIIELHPELARAVRGAGYEIVSADNEGFESEIFFRRGRRATGSFTLREGPCPGLVTIRLLVSVPPRGSG